MDDQPQHGHEAQYAPSPWIELNGYHASQHHSPDQEYGSFGFMPGPQPLSMESTFGQMNPPIHPTHQPLRPLAMPPWPSTLTSQSAYSAPILPTTSTSLPLPTPISSHPVHTSTPRRTLTDADRRRMCLYHEENPTVKQTEIGAMFGVERSTVSKVLRQKEKYLFPEGGSRSPIRRSKGRFPDIERALSNWARNQQKCGLAVTDGMIKEKAQFFATTVGSSESHSKIANTSWLEKFKLKNHIGGARAARKKSEANESDAGLADDISPTSQTPNALSPVSPHGLPSPSPLPANKSPDGAKVESPDGYVDFGSGYRLANSQSNTSLSSVYTDTAPSSFSAGPTSPTSPFFSQDASSFFPSQQQRLPPLSSNYSRPRSQTFPMLGVDPSYTTPPASEPLTPKYLSQSATAGGPTESPSSDLLPGPLSIDGALAARPQPPHSPSSMPPPSSTNPNSATISPIASSPTQDDARRALEVVMQFFHQQPSGSVDPQEYLTIGKLMEKLKLQGQGLPGGLHRIPEQEMINPGLENTEQSAPLNVDRR
ncbi:MAG: hypothetical protein M1817_004793 [Caeruleum heppii]|nr:MAG: hypothetical protein M1817_004793 [Caeruleum heppii]